MTPSEIFQVIVYVVLTSSLFGLSTGFFLAFIGKR